MASENIDLGKTKWLPDFGDVGDKNGEQFVMIWQWCSKSKNYIVTTISRVTSVKRVAVDTLQFDCVELADRTTFTITCLWSKFGWNKKTVKKQKTFSLDGVHDEV